MIEKAYIYNAIVVSVYDGDTIRVNIDLGFNIWQMNVSVRLLGIDTPEIRGEEREAGLIAKQFVLDRIPVGSDIVIQTEKDSTGKYGRYLATIYYNGGQNNLNEELLLSGNAKIY